MATSFPIPTFARELALENPDAFFLSQSGECFHNVTVTGGKQRAEGPLSMKRELRDVLRSSENWNRRLRHEEMRVLTLGREIKDLTSLLDRLEGEKREAEKQAMTSGHLLQQLESEFARAGERLQTSRSGTAPAGSGAHAKKDRCSTSCRCRLPPPSNSASSWSISRPPDRSNCPACASAATRPRRTRRSDWPGWLRSKSGIAAPPPAWSESSRWSPK